jgi:hypothetical protein
VLNSTIGTARLIHEFDSSNRPGVRGVADYILAQPAASDPVIASSSRVYFPLKYYMRSNASVFLYHFPDDLPKYGGGQIIQPAELVHRPIVESLSGDGVWIIHTTGFSAREIPIPPHWELDDAQRFFDSYPWIGMQFVRHYRIHAAKTGHEP